MHLMLQLGLSIAAPLSGNVEFYGVLLCCMCYQRRDCCFLFTVRRDLAIDVMLQEYGVRVSVCLQGRGFESHLLTG